MQFHKFQQNDKVTYVGSKLGKTLHGKIGIVCARIEKTDSGVVVEFGDDAYVMDEKHLSKFKATEGPRDQGPEVTKRKRRMVDQDEES